MQLRMSAENGQDGGERVQGMIIKALERAGEPINQKELKKSVGLSWRKIENALDEMIEERTVYRYESGRNVMYRLPESRLKELERQLREAEKKLAEIRSNMPGYGEDRLQDIEWAVRNLCEINADRQPPSYEERFGRISDDDYDEILMQVSRSMVAKADYRPPDDERLAVKKSVKVAAMRALDKGSKLRNEIFKEFKKAVEVKGRSNGGSERYKEADCVIKAVEWTETAVAEMANRMRQEIREAAAKAEIAAKKRDGQRLGASVRGDDVLISDYGEDDEALLACEKDLKALRKRAESRPKPGGQDTVAYVDDVLASVERARESAWRAYAESLGGEDSAVHEAARKMAAGADYCAIVWAVRSGKIEEPFTAKALEKSGCDAPRFLQKHSRGPRPLFKERAGKYEIVDELSRNAAKAVNAVWRDPLAR